MRNRNESIHDPSRARVRGVARCRRASAMGLCIWLAIAPGGAKAADFLMSLDGGFNEGNRAAVEALGFTVEERGISTIVTSTDLAGFCVVWINPGASASQQAALQGDAIGNGLLSQYVEGGGTLVVLAGSALSTGIQPVAPGNPGWSSGSGTLIHNEETVFSTGHPYLTGAFPGGTPLSTSTDPLIPDVFSEWFDTDRGVITFVPAGATTIVGTSDGPSMIEYTFGAGNGTVIVSTLMIGAGEGGSLLAPRDNLINYAASFGVCGSPPPCADILVSAKKHTVGAGTHPGSTKEPFVGIEVCAYDKSDGSCPRVECGGISHQHYECIAAGVGENLPCDVAACCTTDDTGECTLNLPAGDYVIISHDPTHLVLPDPLGVSAGDVACGDQIQKHLQQIVRADGKKLPGKSKRFTGSELLIIEPEFVVWDDTEQLYPFVFDSVGDWEISVSVEPPDGFVADYDQLDEVVDNSLEAVQFTITEVGSDLVPTKTEFTIRHNGRVIIVPSSVGILLTPDYALSRGFDVDALRARGLIVEPSELGMSTEKKDETALATPSAIVPTPGR